MPRPLRLALAAVATMATAAALAATVARARVEAAAARIALDTADAEATRAAAAGIASGIAQPTLAATLAALAVKLPPDLRLVEVRRGRDGALRLVLDAPDPDAVRARLKADPWLARFRTRGEDAREDGSLRITLVEAAR